MAGKDTECTAKDSALCRFIGAKDCRACFLAKLNADEQAEAQKKWEITLSFLPDGVDELSESVNCHFCREAPREKDLYALVELAHPEPEYKKPLVLGIGKKVRGRIGSLIPVYIGCCRHCRRAFLVYDTIRWGLPVISGALAVAALAAVPVLNRFAGEISGVAVLVLAFAIGWIAGRLVSAAYRRKKATEMRMNVFEIPVVTEMGEKGWFLPQDNPAVTRFQFTPKSVKSVKRFRSQGNTPQNS